MLTGLEGARLDDLARLRPRDRGGREPAPAELGLEIGDDGEPHVALFTVWDNGPAGDFKRLPEAHPVARPGRFFKRDAGWAIAVPADPRCPRCSRTSSPPTRGWPWTSACATCSRSWTPSTSAPRPRWRCRAPRTRTSTGSCSAESCTPSSAPACATLERRRTFIADEQGLGKTVQALATLEADDAFPAAVLC